MEEENVTTAVAEPVAQVPSQPVVYPEAAKTASTMQELVDVGVDIRVLKSGDMVEGKIISVGKNEVYVDLEG